MSGPRTQDIDQLASEIDALKRQNPKDAAEFVGLLMKAIKARLVYPASSTLPAQFKREFVSRGRKIVHDMGGLELKITSSSIVCDDTPVYESTSRGENLAHVFFRDGVTGLNFDPDIEENELERFVDLAARMMQTVYIDDDVATLLWEENFEHIRYDLIDEGLEIETFEYSTDRFRPKIAFSGDDVERFFLHEGQIDLGAESDSGTPVGGIAISPVYRQAPLPTRQFLDRISEFTQEEKNEIAELLAADGNFRHTEYLITVGFEILGMEKELPGFVEVLGLMGQMLDSFVASGNFDGAVLLLDRMRELATVLKKLKNPRAEKIDNFIFECASRERIALLTKTLNEVKDISSDTLVRYLTSLPWAAIDPLVTALGEVEEFKMRQALCEALQQLAKDHVELLARGLDDERWYVVRNVVNVMGRIGTPRILNYLKRTMRHPDYRVRFETLTAAAKIVSDDSIDFMIMALSDADTKIQTAGLKYLMEHKAKRALPAIENIIKDKEFKSRPPDLLREFLEAYAMLGQERALPLLKSFLGKKLLFQSPLDERLRNCAIAALGKIESVEALNMLRKLANAKDSRAASIALRALQHIKT